MFLFLVFNFRRAFGWTLFKISTKLQHLHGFFQDETELPNNMKRPFGKHGGGTIFEREGIFDWDYKVGAFRTGLERDQDGLSFGSVSQLGVLFYAQL